MIAGNKNHIARLSLTNPTKNIPKVKNQSFLFNSPFFTNQRKTKPNIGNTVAAEPPINEIEPTIVSNVPNNIYLTALRKICIISKLKISFAIRSNLRTLHLLRLKKIKKHRKGIKYFENCANNRDTLTPFNNAPRIKITEKVIKRLINLRDDLLLVLREFVFIASLTATTIVNILYGFSTILGK